MISGILLSGAVRAAVVLAFGLGVHALLSRAAAATRRLVLVLTLAAAIVVPIAAAVGPQWTVQTPAAFAVFAHESEEESAAQAVPASDSTAAGRTTRSPVIRPSGRHDATGAIVLVWLVVAAALLVRAAASQLRAHALARRATPVARATWIDALAGRRMDVRASSELDSPSVTGLLSPTIVIPLSALDWPAARCGVVLVHELAHVRRHDVLAQAVADLACAIHWCNPLAWLCARRLRVERELAADDAVLAAGVRPSRYAEELVAVATSVALPGAALAMAERSSLEARIASILAAGLARAPLAARGTIAIVAAGSALAAVVASASPQLRGADAAPRAGTANEASMQRVAEEELAVIAKEWAPELATIVVLDPATGEVLANTGLSAGRRTDVATTVALVPGSTFKPVLIAAALELHAITVGQKFDCGPQPRRYGDKEVRDSSANGTLDVAHLLAVSSNIGTSQIFDALGGDNLALWLHRFHFGETPAIQGAATGAFPASIGTGTFEGANVAMGEGLTATPLQMIAAYGAIASDGVYHAPTLDRGGSTAERLVSSETASSVMALLETAVVDETATGRAARVEGVHVAGKTGTAEWTAPDGRERTYASFIGIADLPSRRIVALVGIELPHNEVSGGRTFSGGSAAAPVFARLMQRIRGG